MANMNIGEMPLLNMLRERMSYLNARQDVLSQNVANADSPGYAAKDLKAENFDDILGQANASMTTSMLKTDPNHMDVPQTGTGQYAGVDAPDTESGPDGNTVSLEAEMMKVADTQAQYQAATNIYSKAMSMMRTAIGH
jgi:flagellar basal-body rod protein FlgB